jgi:hypothetical protein
MVQRNILAKAVIAIPVSLRRKTTSTPERQGAGIDHATLSNITADASDTIQHALGRVRK